MAGQAVFPVETTTGPPDLASVEERKRGVMAEHVVFLAVNTTGHPLSSAQLSELRCQLGHAPARPSLSVLENARYKISMDDVKTAVDPFGRSSRRAETHDSIASFHVPQYPGYAVFRDVVYLQAATFCDKSSLLMIDSFSRFAICVTAPSLHSASVSRLFGISRVRYFGCHRFLIRDGARG